MNGYEEADRLTDAELERLERELERIYREAAEDMQKEISEYFTSFAKREKQYRAMVEAGTMTEEEFTRWRLGAIGRGERMKALRDKLAERMTQANEEAAAMMNRAMMGIFVLNGNYTAYEIFRGEGIDWTLWNEEAVRRIIRDDPDLMPYYPAERAVRRGIDLDWGRRQITAQVISSILLGDSLGTIAEKLMRRIEGMNATSAKRTARTAVTEAQNAGRQSVFEMAAELGIKLHRRWVATKDLRTRHAHAMADHQIVAVDEPFTVGGEKIMFPGSGSLGASGWNLYNCRCTVVSSEKEGIEAEPRMMRVWDPVKGEWVLMEDVSYSQWYEAMKAKHGESAMEAALKMAKYRTSDREQHKEYRAILGKEVPKLFADFQKLKYTTPDEWEIVKTHKRQTVFVNNAPCETTPKKFTDFFLKPGAKHSQEFFEAGYTADDALQLRYDMATLFSMDKAVDREIKPDGAEKFNIYMELGVGKKRTFRTSWQIDKPGDRPRIVTAFRQKRGKGEKENVQ